MIDNARSWLPANTTLPAVAHDALANMVDAWSRAWFVRDGLRLVGKPARVAVARGNLRKLEWHVLEGSLAIGVPAAGLAGLGAMVLSVAAKRAERRPADLALLEKLGSACLEDLQERAAALLPSRAAARWSVREQGIIECGTHVHRAEIAGAPSSDVCLTLELSSDLFAAFVKSRLPKPPKRAPLGAPDSALAALPVRVAATLGGCTVTVSELATLAEGDVLVLDRALDTALPLTIEGVVSRGACTVAHDADCLVLRISQAPVG